MKTHEIGIGSFASVMINGKEKHWDSRERQGGERLHFCSACTTERAWSCAFNEETTERKTKRRSRNDWEKEALFAYSLLSKGSCFELHVWPDVVHTFVVIWAKISLTRRNLIRISRYFSAPLCSDNPWWSFQVAHKLAQNNSRSHRNFILLTACSFTCVSAVCVYNAWTRPEPPVSSFWLWRALCLCGFSPECCGRSG